MRRSSRALSIVFLTGIAEFALILFSIVPPPFNIILIFLNGFPLGMIWGLVFAYLEGRKTTEILGTILSISFIVSSGFVKKRWKNSYDQFSSYRFSNAMDNRSGFLCSSGIVRLVSG
jgi:ABC-type uncharacterized transport system permease subunit